MCMISTQPYRAPFIQCYLFFSGLLYISFSLLVEKTYPGGTGFLLLSSSYPARFVDSHVSKHQLMYF